jgi:hypothetical protein
MTACRAPALLLSVLLLAATGPAVSEAASKRAAVVETHVIGHTVKGRDIVAWRVGQPSSGRGVVVLATMHGNEVGPKRILVNLAAQWSGVADQTDCCGRSGPGADLGR